MGEQRGRRRRRPSPSPPARPGRRRRTRRGRRAPCRSGSARGRSRRWRVRRPDRPAGGAPSSRPAISRSQSDWPSQPLVAPISTMSSQGGSAMPTAFAASSSTPRPPIAGVGRIAAALGLIVEADVAGHDREIQRLAGGGHAADGGGELAHDLRLFRIAEIHVVGQRQRAGADRGQVAPGLGHRLRAAGLGVGGAVAGRAVGGQRQRAVVALQLHHRGVGGARALHRLAADGAVVLVPDPGARAEIRAGDQLLQRARSGRRDPRSCAGLSLRLLRRLGGGAVIQRRLRRSAAPAGCRPRPRRGGARRCGRCRSGGRSPRSPAPISRRSRAPQSSRSGRSTISMRSWLSDSMNS